MIEVFPFQPTPERRHVLSRLMRSIAFHETIFSDYQKGCEEGCREKALKDMCAACQAQMALVARSLTAPGTRAWEVWNETPELVGIIYLSDIVQGQDATGHFVFFDSDLLSKTATIQRLIEWAFESHDDWRALKRLTVEIPAYAHRFARYVERRLGFGGDFRARGGLHVEGVKHEAVLWRGRFWDVYIMGRVNEAFPT